MNHYERKRADRVERYRELADKAARRSDSLAEESRRMMSVIPMGQPILIGHHSEKSDRSYRNRAWAKMGRSVEWADKAKYFREKAAAAESNNAISSDDPEAVEKLQERIDKAESIQELMRQANKIVQAKPKNQSTPEKISALVALKMTEEQAAKLFEPDFCGRYGFADYQLTNNNANIRRLKQRLEGLKNLKSQEDQERTINGIRIVANVADNRVRLYFPDKPDATVRHLLKSRGFRWSPTEGAWQRHISNSAIYAAKEIAGQQKGPRC